MASRPIAGRRGRLLGVALGLAAAYLLVPPPPARAQDCVVIEDFSKGAVGELPPGWKLRKDEGRGVYTIQEEGGRRFLHARSKGLGIQAAKEFDWDLTRYPILVWSWRAVEFPKGADERQSKTNDSAASVYAAFPHTKWSLKAVKYIWSAVVPVGTRLSSNMNLTQAIVVQSGADAKGKWIDERQNVLENYKAFFGTSDVPKPGGIAVLTDADDTKSEAQGDYANFRACAK